MSRARMYRPLLCASVGALLSTTFLSSAWAQDGGQFARDKNVSVTERPHPEYAARNVRLGAFTLAPTLRTELEYTDNVYGVSTSEQSDTLVRLQPSATLSSNWSRHSLNFYANASIERFFELQQEDNEAWLVGGRGRLDVQRGAAITGEVSTGHSVEARTSSNTVTASDRPIEFDQSNAAVTGYKEFNRVRVGGTASWTSFSYDDGRTPLGVPIDQSYRDRDVTRLSGRVDYAISPDTSIFVQVSGDWRDYDKASIVQRDSSGVETLIGADFELSNLWRGYVGVGWVEQSFDAAAFDDFSGYSVRARVEWFPTQLTTVTFRASRSIEDSGLIGSAGIVSDQVGVNVDHELLRNVIISGALGYEKNEFLDLSREDDRWNLGVSGTYLLNRSVGITAGYSRLDQDSTGAGAGPDFVVNKASIGLILKY